MKKIITILVALSLVSPALYADQTVTKKVKTKQTTEISVKKQYIAKNPTTKKHIANNKVKHTKIVAHKADSKKIVRTGLNKNKKHIKVTPAPNQQELAKKETTVPNVQTNESNVTQLGENTGLGADKIIPQDKGFFQNVWDEFTGFFR